ncbi:MAG TPA: peptidoglycan DD-metalloendopeptidase family protein, partial [Microlunatus sp.]
SQPSRRTPRTLISDLEPEDRRGWLSHGIAALAISGLGLAVAASVSLTTRAETTTVDAPRTTVTGGVLQASGSTLPGQTAKPKGDAATDASPALDAFSRRTAEGEEASRDSVRTAIVEERAAQRSEDLTESAEGISREAVERGNNARRQELAAADRARRVAAVKAARERTRRAIQVRVTAEVQRELAEKARKEREAREKAARERSSSNESSDSSADSSERDSQNNNSSSNNSSNNNSSNNSGGGSSGGSGGGSGGGARSPVPGAIVGASFGATGAWARYHTGLDFRAGFGTPIRAVTSGVVVYAGNKGNWAGNHVAVRHAGGYTSMSSHMQSMAVSAGQSVSAGQVIGHVGSTGRSFGAHLHFEIYPPGVQPGDVYSAINPIPWLRARGVDTN